MSSREGRLLDVLGASLTDLKLHERDCGECRRFGQRTTCETGRALWAASTAAQHSWRTSRWPNEGVSM